MHCEPFDLDAYGKYREHIFESRIAQQLLGLWQRCPIGCVISVGPNDYATATDLGWIAVFDQRPTTWQRFLNHVRSAPWDGDGNGDDDGDSKRFRVRGDAVGTGLEFAIESVHEWQVDDPTPYIERALTDCSRECARKLVRAIENCMSWSDTIRDLAAAILRAYVHNQDIVRPGNKATALRDRPLMDTASTTQRKVDAALAWIGAMRSAPAHRGASLRVDDGDLLAWEDVDDRVIAQRIRLMESTMELEVVGLGARCRFEITSAFKDICDHLRSLPLRFDTESIDKWIDVVSVLTQPGCSVLHRILSLIREKIVADERMVFRQDDAWPAPYHDVYDD
jgi:hypothetical protein